MPPYKPSYLQPAQASEHQSLGTPFVLILFGGGSFWLLFVIVFLLESIAKESLAGIGMLVAVLGVFWAPAAFLSLTIGVVWASIRMHRDDSLHTRANSQALVFGFFTLLACIPVGASLFG